MSRSACLQSIYELAKQDERVIFIGSDLAPNTLADFKRDFPDRYFMEGIAEQHIIGMAAGLAKEGFIVYVNTIASFITRRCFEQLVIDVCMHNLPVRLIGNGGGLLYAPLGATHCSIEDISILRSLPNMTIVACSDSEEMREFMPKTLMHAGPMYIRLGKDADAILPGRNGYQPVQLITADTKPDIAMVGTGVMTNRLLLAAKILKEHGIDAGVIHMPRIKPMPMYGVGLRRMPRMVVTCEEGIISGGLGTVIMEDINGRIPVLRLGLPDAFPHHYGEQDDLLETYGLQPKQIAMRVKEAYDRL